MSRPAKTRSAANSLDQALADLLSAGPVRLVSAYLFGSHAEGRAHRESDVDVGILLPYESPSTPQGRFEVRIQVTSFLMSQLGQDAVDVTVLNDAPPLLARRIVTHGRRVLCTDPEADHAFVRDVQLRAADLEPFLRRTRRIKLASITR